MKKHTIYILSSMCLVANSLFAMEEEALVPYQKQPQKTYIYAKLDTDLIAAIKNNNLQEVKNLLKAGANLHAKHASDSNRTAIHYAAQNCDPTILKFLIAQGADIHTQDNNGVLPIHLAAQANCTDNVKELLSIEANANAKDKEGKTALHYAVEVKPCNPDPLMIKELVSKGASLKAETGLGHTPLMSAIQAGCKVGVEALIKAGADVNAPNSFSQTPLQFSVDNRSRNKTVETLQALLQANAAVNEAPTEKGETALFTAVYTDFAPSVAALIAAGADVNHANKYGDIPLLSVHTPEIAQMLIEAGSNIHRKNQDGISPLEQAAKLPRGPAKREALLKAFIVTVSPQEIQHIIPGIMAFKRHVGQSIGKDLSQKIIIHELIQDIINKKLALAKQYIPNYPEDKLTVEIKENINKMLKKEIDQSLPQHETIPMSLDEALGWFGY